jgi:hypothetical protein
VNKDALAHWGLLRQTQTQKNKKGNLMIALWAETCTVFVNKK